MPDPAPLIVIIAIDPGASGGIVWNEDGKVNAVKMPPSSLDIVTFLQRIAVKNRDAIVELHLESPATGGWGPAGLASIAKLFRMVGGLEYAGLMVGWKVNLVDPKKWQKAQGFARAQGESKTAWKNRMKAKAEDLFPDLPVTLSTADALLIYNAAARGLLF